MAIHAVPIVKHAKAQAVYECPFAPWLCDGETIVGIREATIEADDQGTPPTIEQSAISNDKQSVLVELKGGTAPSDSDLTITVDTSRDLLSGGPNQIPVIFPIQVRE